MCADSRRILPLEREAFGDMTAVMGSREAAMQVARQAMDRVARSPYPSAVPGCYPVPWQMVDGTHGRLGFLDSWSRESQQNIFDPAKVLVAIFGMEEAEGFDLTIVEP